MDYNNPTNCFFPLILPWVWHIFKGFRILIHNICLRSDQLVYWHMVITQLNQCLQVPNTSNSSQCIHKESLCFQIYWQALTVARIMWITSRVSIMEVARVGEAMDKSLKLHVVTYVGSVKYYKWESDAIRQDVDMCTKHHYSQYN